jgi:malonyl-CoA/methylmalonyl-CoA synthetase
LNLYELIRGAFPADLQRTVLEGPGGLCYSYADLEAESARLAQVLQRLGAKPGDRVTVQVEKSPRVLPLYLACLRAGLVYHPLNTAYRPAELAYFLDNAEPRVVISDPGGEALFRSLHVEQLLTLGADGRGSLWDAAQNFPPVFGSVPRQDDDMAALLYSSGTTGRPKGIMLSHGNLAANGQTLADLWGFSPQDRLLHVLPIFHVHGLFIALHCALLSGASLRWLQKFDPAGVLEALPDCTVMMGVPTYYTRLLADEHFGAEHCRTMRLFISGSAPLLTETFETFRARTGHVILERYGMSETGMNTSNPLHGERRAGTVGLPLPDVELRVVGPGGAPLSPGETGNLQVRGPNVFSGYWRMPDKTREDFTADGFFDTGDKAQIAADGYVSIVGRAKDMIITGGLNVYPKEIELLLDQESGVVESAVIGVPHPDFGEAVVAVVVLAPDSQPDQNQLMAGLRHQLAGFKLPKRIFLLPDLPRNAMGKVQKNLLREKFAETFVN